MPEPNTRAYWRRTKELMLTMLGLWTAVSLGLPMWGALLNQITIPYLDLPLGFFMASQGGLIAFLLMLHVFARRQDRIDRDHFSDVC